MNTNDTEDNTNYKVVMNHEGQYSIWPADRENPVGWSDGGKSGSKAECLAYVKEVWTDMRPLSAQEEHGEARSDKASRVPHMSERTTATSTVGSWIANRKSSSHARLRLFCFPYAGGSALIFRSWSNVLPADVEVCPVQLPGRGTRLMERPFTDLSSLIQVLAQALSSLLDKPFAIFGHSLGALVGFELARQFRRKYGVNPASPVCFRRLRTSNSPSRLVYQYLTSRRILSGRASPQRYPQGGVGARRTDGDCTSFLTG